MWGRVSELFSDASHFRRLVAGSCSSIAPVVLLVGALSHLQGKEAAAARLGVAENPDRYYWAHAILLVGLALFLPWSSRSCICSGNVGQRSVTWEAVLR